MENRHDEDRIWLTVREKELLVKRYQHKWEEACERRARAEIAAARDAAECFAVYQTPEYLAPEDRGLMQRTLRAVGLREEKYPLPVPEAYPATAEEAKKAIPFLFYIFSKFGLNVKCEHRETERGAVPALYVPDEEARMALIRALRLQEIAESVEKIGKILKSASDSANGLDLILEDIKRIAEKTTEQNKKEIKKLCCDLKEKIENNVDISDDLKEMLEDVTLILEETATD